MHKIIRILCYAENKEEARETAEDILNESLVGENKPFDYGSFFDEEHAISRWGKMLVVCLANSKKGKKLIKDGMENTKKDFKENIKKVRELINFYSDEELFEEKTIDIKKQILENLEDKPITKNIFMFKYYCNCLGQYKGSNIWIYDNDGEGIRNSEHLKNVLNKWEYIYKDKKGEANPYKNLKVFVIPCDCHY